MPTLQAIAAALTAALTEASSLADELADELAAANPQANEPHQLPDIRSAVGSQVLADAAGRALTLMQKIDDLRIRASHPIE